MAARKKKRRRGRPTTTGIGKILGVRCHPPLIQRIDGWSETQVDKPSRAEAMRRLIEMGLESQQSTGAKSSPKAAAKASQLAGQMIDMLSDGSAPIEEREKRKRRLLKGPSEFRKIRGGLPKSKN